VTLQNQKTGEPHGIESVTHCLIRMTASKTVPQK